MAWEAKEMGGPGSLEAMRLNISGVGGPVSGGPGNGRLRNWEVQLVRGAGWFSHHQINTWMENECERG